MPTTPHRGSTWTKKDTEDLAAKIEQKYGWKPKEFQMQAIEAQLLQKDVVVHAGTGSGKTAIAAGPHVHKSNKGRVTIMVSPLLALQNEQVNTFKTEFNLEAVAINSSHGGCTPEALLNVREGKYQIILISPEMLLSKRFINEVLRKKDFTSRVISVVVDEAHVVSRWGAGFRKRYGELGMVRAFLPRGTPIVALSATLPPRVHDDVLKRLQYPKNGYISINVGNDRPNVSLVIRAIQHTMTTYADLDFLIPNGVTNPSGILKTFIYADNVLNGVDIEDHLNELLPYHLRGQGLIRPFSAAFSHECRDTLMDMFRAGTVRILICTDAAGMGCNIPDIDVVIQWKLPDSVSTFVQRAGRAARGDNRTGLAVLLAERSAYSINIEAQMTNGKHAATAKGKQVVKKTKDSSSKTAAQKRKEAKAYAAIHGVNRGAYGGHTDFITVNQRPPLDCLDPNEGLHVLIQATVCRRKILAEIYGNATPSPSVPCCDICTPFLLDRTRPAPPQPKRRQAATKRGEPSISVQTELHLWRTKIFERDFQEALFAPDAILKNETLELLSSVGPIRTMNELEKILGGQWSWVTTYGRELLEALKGLDIGEMVPKPTASRKRALTTTTTPNSEESLRHAQRQRTSEEGSAQLPAVVTTQLASQSNTVTPQSRTINTTQAALPPPVVAPRPVIPAHLQQNPYAAHLLFSIPHVNQPHNNLSIQQASAYSTYPFNYYHTTTFSPSTLHTSSTSSFSSRGSSRAQSNMSVASNILPHNPSPAS